MTYLIHSSFGHLIRKQQRKIVDDCHYSLLRLSFPQRYCKLRSLAPRGRHTTPKRGGGVHVEVNHQAAHNIYIGGEV